MNQPPAASRAVQLTLLFFALMPCLPGIVFLLVALVTDPHNGTRDHSPAGEARYAQIWERTRRLYLVGGCVLVAGTTGTAVVIWKIARAGQAAGEEGDAGVQER